MKPPRKLHPLPIETLRTMTSERLLQYRQKALSLEESLETSDFCDTVSELDPSFIWFKNDSRWQPLYDV